MKKVKGAMFLLLALVLVVVSVLSGCAKKEVPQTLRIGVLATLSGPGSEAEILGKDGALMAAEWINDKGGVTIKGDKYLIEVIAEDQKTTPDTVVGAANKLVYDQKVKFIVGGMVPTMTIVAATVTEPAKVLRIAQWSTGMPEELNPETPYTFLLSSGNRWCIPALYDYLAEYYPNVRRIALTGPEEASVYLMHELATSEAEKHGLEVVFQETYPWTATDFYPLWTKMLAQKIDAVDYTLGFPLMCGSVTKAGRELGFKGPVFGAGGAPIDIVRDIVGPELATDFYNTSFLWTSPEMTPMIKQISKLCLDKYGMFDACYLYGWDALWVMVQAIEKAQSLDPTEVAKSWETMESVETSCGTAKMGGLKTYGLNHVVAQPIPISRLKDGEAEHVKWLPAPEIP